MASHTDPDGEVADRNNEAPSTGQRIHRLQAPIGAAFEPDFVDDGKVRTHGRTAEQWRAAAQQTRTRNSHGPDDEVSDHFLTSYASDLNSRLYEARAQICDNGGRASFRALFDLEGRMLAAKEIRVPNRFTGGTDRVWGVLASDDPNSEIVSWVRPSEAESPKRRGANNAKKGISVGRVMAPAAADLDSPQGARGIGGMSSVFVSTFRTDQGFSRDVEVVSDGRAMDATVELAGGHVEGQPTIRNYPRLPARMVQQ